MVGVSDTLFVSIVLLPGFLCIFLPHKVINVKIRLSEFELTLISLIISAVIFILTILTYICLQLAFPLSIASHIEVSKISVNSLIGNNFFLITYLFYTIVFFIGGLYSISHDILRPIRKLITGVDSISAPEKYVWDIALNKYKGYVIVETKDNDFFLGWLDNWTCDELEKELLLAVPEYIDKKKSCRSNISNWIGIAGIHIHRILFLSEDIKRIYYVTDPKKLKLTDKKK